MEIHAYPEEYLVYAQRILGDAVDFAVMTLGVDPDVFGNAFAVSDVSVQFGSGNPRYVAGMNGCELARKVLTETGISFSDAEDIMYIDKGPEYWAGWALAFFQWQSRYTFMEILTNISLEKIIAMYPSFHEMDIQQFADRLWDRMAEKKTNLRMRREACGLSQSELAAFSRVPLRQIQLFEQLRRNINKTASETLLRLSRALSCSMEDLMEKQDRLNNG